MGTSTPRTTVEDRIEGTNDFLVAQIGLEAALQFMDYITARELKPQSWESVSQYVSEKHHSGVQIDPEVFSTLYERVRQSVIDPKSSEDPSTLTGMAYQLKYDLTARLGHQVPLLFMDYGYQPDEDMQHMLGEHNPNFRHAVQLYHHVASLVDMEGRRVLEVGCGNGGGAAYLSNTFNPASLEGVDICHSNVRFAVEHFGNDTLTFSYADAGKLPFSTESFDVVANVESLHCYPHPSDFLNGVNIVLDSGGVAVVADLFQESGLRTFREMSASASLSIVKEEDITDEVRRALPPYIQTLQSLASRLPRELQQFYTKFIGSRAFDTPGSNWEGRNLTYNVFVLEKQ